jgi:hypothetical protein
VKKTSRDSGVLGRGRVGCLATGFAHTVPDGRTDGERKGGGGSKTSVVMHDCKVFCGWHVRRHADWVN